MSIEKSLENIADKASLHAWVDSIPEGAKGLVLIAYPDEAVGGWHESKTFGTPMASELVWLMRSYEHRLLTQNNAGEPR
jgi:hypothetical protein